MSTPNIDTPIVFRRDGALIIELLDAGEALGRALLSGFATTAQINAIYRATEIMGERSYAVNPEIKRFYAWMDTSDEIRRINFRVTIGATGDEGTIRTLLRTTRLLSVGSRGGYRLHEYSPTRTTRGPTALTIRLQR